MKLPWLLLGLAGLPSFATGAAAQVVRGVVLEETTHAPVAAAHVELVARDADDRVAALSDSTGAFVLAPRRAGVYTLHVRHLAFAPLYSDTFTLGRDEAVDVEIRLAHHAIALEPLVVTARVSTRLAGFHERAGQGGCGRVIARDEAERWRGARASELLRSVPGVRVTTSAAGRNSVTMRSLAGVCSPTIYLDGMRMLQAEESGIDEFITTAVLEGVEVYTSAASVPVALAGPDQCGVIAFWTRDDAFRPFSWRRFAVGAGVFLLLLLSIL
jgi:hypothetical protein